MIAPQSYRAVKDFLRAGDASRRDPIGAIDDIVEPLVALIHEAWRQADRSAGTASSARFTRTQPITALGADLHEQLPVPRRRIGHSVRVVMFAESVPDPVLWGACPASLAGWVLVGGHRGDAAVRDLVDSYLAPGPAAVGQADDRSRVPIAVEHVVSKARKVRTSTLVPVHERVETKQLGIRDSEHGVIGHKRPRCLHVAGSMGGEPRSEHWSRQRHGHTLPRNNGALAGDPEPARTDTADDCDASRAMCGLCASDWDS